MYIIRKTLVSIIAVFAVAFPFSLAMPNQALAQVDVFKQCSSGEASASAVCKGGDKLFGPNSIWTRIIVTLTYVIGAVAVLMIVLGGLRYTLSGGDEKAITSAKNTILYAIIGLIVAVMSNAIVNFVLVNI